MENQQTQLARVLTGAAISAGFAFLFLTAVLMPALAVATVGSYGLAVWIYQMMAGPPGPPTR